MMRLIKKMLPVILLSAIITSACDQLSEDIKIQKKDIVQLSGKKITTTYNSPAVINLQDKLESPDISGITTSLSPQHGQIEISQSGMVVYSKNLTLDAPSGDRFALNFLDQDSSIIDIDTVEVIFVADTSMLSCNNGALSDFVNTYKNANVNFNVLWNDGYCPEETKDLIIEIIEQPVNGIVIPQPSQDIDLPLPLTLTEGTITYKPKADFTGKDKFLYKLTLTDKNNIKHKSFAYVYVNVLDESMCQDKAMNDHYSFHEDSANYILAPLKNDMVCEGTRLEMGKPKYGSLKELSPGEFLYIPFPTTYYPLDTLPDDMFNYVLVSENGSRTGATITISIDLDSSFCNALPYAQDDEFIFYKSSYSLVMDVLANDTWCKPVTLDDGFKERTYFNGKPTVINGKLIYKVFDPTIPFDEKVEYTIYETENPFNSSTAKVWFSYDPGIVSDSTDIGDSTDSGDGIPIGF